MSEKSNNNLQKLNKSLVCGLFVTYLLILLWIIVFKYNSPKAINVLLNNYFKLNFKGRFLDQFNHNFDNFNEQYLRQMLLNIPVFIPFTLMLPLFFKKQKILRDLLITFLFSLSIEIFQLFFALGGFEFFDLLYNFLGGLIGCIIFKILRRFTKDVVINYICIVLLIVALPLAFYAIINTTIHYEYYVPFFNGEGFKYLF